MKRLDIANRDEIENKLMSHPDKDMIAENLRLKHFRSGTKTASDIEVFIKKLINRGFKPDLITIDYFECAPRLIYSIFIYANIPIELPLLSLSVIGVIK